MVCQTNLAYKHSQTYLWFLTLKIFCSVYMLISTITPKDTWNLPNGQKSWKQKGNKILRNIKTRWISMFNLVKHVLFEYHTLLMKMALDAPTKTFTKSNLCLLTNVELLLGLNVVMPLLEVVHSLIKFAQL